MARKLIEEVPFQLCLPPSSFKSSNHTHQMYKKVINNAPTKSCALNHLPTTILKKLLPDMLPFITHMSNASLHNRKPVPCHRHNKVGKNTNELDTGSYWPVYLYLCVCNQVYTNPNTVFVSSR